MEVWEAVQAGAISDSKLMKILNSSKSDEIIKRAMPKASTTLSSAKLGKAQAMLANGYTLLHAKADAIQAAKDNALLYKEAIKAMREYGGVEDNDESENIF